MKNTFSRITLSVFIFLGIVIILGNNHLSPYGEKYLPKWVEQGNQLVFSIENYKKQHGVYPETFPVNIDLKQIPGCKKMNYIKHLDVNGKEYYRIYMYIHLREVVIFDSRHNLDESHSWGNYKIYKNWMWTKD